jgi:ribose 5-phosphate isomerase B
MGARVIGTELAKAIADAWLAETMNFDASGRSAGNVCAIDEVDAKYNKR